VCLQPEIRLHFDRISVILDFDVLEHTSTMNLLLFSATGVCAVLGIAFFILFRTLVARGAKAGMAVDWENLFSPSRYKPMERLLDEADYSFLKSQPGYSRGLAKRVRASRVSIFRGYSRCLGRDFSRVSSAIKMLMVHAQGDRSALAGVLLKQRLLFSVNMVRVEFQLFLHVFGLRAPNVEVRNLVESLDAMRMQLRTLSLAIQPSAA